MDRGRQNRGTTSGLGLPLGRPLTASDNAIRCIGRTRLTLLRFYAFGPAAPGGISALLLTALHPPAALWKKVRRVLHPICAFRYETMGILANFPAFVKSKVSPKNRYANFTNRSLSRPGIWYNMTTTKRLGEPMPGEYSRMMERCTRDTSFCRAATIHAGTTQVNTEESPDAMSGLLPFCEKCLGSPFGRAVMRKHD